MNFSIHIDESTAGELQRLVQETGETRNAIIREAIRMFIGYHSSAQWPEEVLELAGIDENMPAFESHRDEFEPPVEDPLE